MTRALIHKVGLAIRASIFSHIDAQVSIEVCLAIEIGTYAQIQANVFDPVQRAIER